LRFICWFIFIHFLFCVFVQFIKFCVFVFVLLVLWLFDSHNPIIRCPFDITEKSICCTHVLISRILHELGENVYCLTKVGSSDCEIN